MLALLFTLLTVAAFAVSAIAMLATWRRYGADWDALSAEAARPARKRFINVKVIEQRLPIPAYAAQAASIDLKTGTIRTKRPVFVRKSEWRVAA